MRRKHSYKTVNLSYSDTYIGFTCSPVRRRHGSQKASHDTVALDEDTRPTIDDLVGHAIILDVSHHGLVLGPGLEPERRNVKRLGLLEDAQGDL